jgi:hypothetical protein
MTTLPEFFQQTSDQPYDRHKYKLYMESGKVFKFNCYEDVQSQWSSSPYCRYVEVMDRKRK